MKNVNTENTYNYYLPSSKFLGKEPDEGWCDIEKKNEKEIQKNTIRTNYVKASKPGHWPNE